MLIFVVEDDEGVAHLATTLEKAKMWIKNHGEDWAGEGAIFTIVAQKLDMVDNWEWESFGSFDCNGAEVK